MKVGDSAMREDELYAKIEQAKQEGSRERAVQIAKNIIKTNAFCGFVVPKLGLSEDETEDIDAWAAIYNFEIRVMVQRTEELEDKLSAEEIKELKEKMREEAEKAADRAIEIKNSHIQKKSTEEIAEQMEMTEKQVKLQLAIMRYIPFESSKK